MQTRIKKIELKCSGPLCKWSTLERESQSLSATTSPSGRYFFVSYLFGVNVVDTQKGEEVFHLIHPDQSYLAESEFNICGFIALSDTVGYTIERTGPQYGDYYLRKIEFDHEDQNYTLDERPLTLAFDVKWLTACFDYQHETQELHVILRHEIAEEDRVDGRRDRRLFWSYKLIDDAWRKTKDPFSSNALNELNSWDWFPKFYNNDLYIFPVTSSHSTVYEKLQQLNHIAKIDSQTGEMKMLPVKGGLEKWAKGSKYENALFVDNMDFKWVGNSLFLLFVVVIQDENRRSSFQNRMATFSFDSMEWREIEVGNFCKGEFSPNPYRMQIAPNDKIYLLIPSHGHPCTTFGKRSYSDRRRLLWVPPTTIANKENEESDDAKKSVIYSIPLGHRNPSIFEQVAQQVVDKIHPQLIGREFHEYPGLLDNSRPPCKKPKKESLSEEEEMVGAGACRS